MDRDPLSLQEIEWSLWCTLMCHCEKCGTQLDLDQFGISADAPAEWAKAAAPFVKTKGWSAPDEWELRCNECTARFGCE
jgi:hypothetical protein